MFEQILKVAKDPKSTRDTIVEVVVRKAAELALSRGITPAAAEAEIWEKVPGLYQAYNSAPAGKAKVEKREVPIGEAEAWLDRASVAIAKLEHITPEQAYLKACERFPNVYEEAQRQIARRCRRETEPKTAA